MNFFLLAASLSSTCSPGIDISSSSSSELIPFEALFSSSLLSGAEKITIEI
jgi:hypothetical protein